MTNIHYELHIINGEITRDDTLWAYQCWTPKFSATKITDNKYQARLLLVPPDDRQPLLIAQTLPMTPCQLLSWAKLIRQTLAFTTPDLLRECATNKGPY